MTKKSNTELMTTEQQVKDALGITDWRKVTKDQIIEFASNMQNIDPNVAIACINQMPEFKEQSTTIVKYFYDLCNTELQKNTSEAIIQYKQIIENLQKQLSKRNINETERQFIIEQMVYLADKIDSVEIRKDAHKRTVLQFAGIVGTFAIAAGAAILGGRIELPLKRNT